MNKETAKDQLLRLYESQIVDLTLMSKIELGDDVIEEIRRLKEVINAQEAEYDGIVEPEKRALLKDPKYSSFQDLNTLTDEQDAEIQKKFNEAIKEELSKPENQEFLKKWNEDGTRRNEK